MYESAVPPTPALNRLVLVDDDGGCPTRFNATTKDQNSGRILVVKSASLPFLKFLYICCLTNDPVGTGEPLKGLRVSIVLSDVIVDRFDQIANAAAKDPAFSRKNSSSVDGHVSNWASDRPPQSFDHLSVGVALIRGTRSENAHQDWTTELRLHGPDPPRRPAESHEASDCWRNDHHPRLRAFGSIVLGTQTAAELV